MMTVEPGKSLFQPPTNNLRPTQSSCDTYTEQMIGVYSIGQTIGRGSFGKVKKGRHILTGDPVAIKILNRQKLRNANMDKKIHREIEILRLFSHSNICRLYEVISTPTDMYLIMEYVEGGELYDYIVQRGKIRESDARYIFQQIICAIEYCHHFRVVHRDLKPENILLGPCLQVKLIDFGLSNIMRDGEFLVTSCGSPNYAAPEIISGKMYFGPEVDVWSCGVILYALICGCLPFDEESIPLLFSRIKKGKYLLPSNMPSGPRELIQQILTVDPLTRLTVPQIRDNAWFNQRLPARLAYHEGIFLPQEDRIVSALASETAKKLGIREKDVRREISLERGHAYVAYNILLDAKRRKEITAEAREMGMITDDSNSFISPLNSSHMTRSNGIHLRATEQEFNMGLMLSQSPAMEVLLDGANASVNKVAYNSCCFVPASAHECRPSQPPAVAASAQCGGVPVGSFSMTKWSNTPNSTGRLADSVSLPLNSSRDVVDHNVGTILRPEGLLNNSNNAAPLLGMSLTEYLRVGSVARKHATYTAQEEQFLVQNNCGWRVGLMTDWHPKPVLNAIYDVLQANGMEWKVAGVFRLKIRTTAATWTIIHNSSLPHHTRHAQDLARAATMPVVSFTKASCGSSLPSVSRSSMQSDSSKSFAYNAKLLSSALSSSKETLRAAPSLPSEGNNNKVEPEKFPQVYLGVHLLRIHERHDKGFLIDFSIVNRSFAELDVVLKLSNDLINRIQ